MNVKPDSLLKRRGGGGGGDKQGDDKTEHTEMDSRQLNNDSESIPLHKKAEDEKQQVADKIKSGIESGNGMQTSQSMLSSMLEGSEDEESKQASKKKKGKDVVKDLSEKEGK